MAAQGIVIISGVVVVVVVVGVTLLSPGKI